MHDYLAEEVLDHLDATFVDFLVRVSLLDDIDPDAAAALASTNREHATQMFAMSEELALVSRRDAATDYRFVPLVREFLRARLSTLSSDAEIQQMHLRLGQQFEGTNWRISATHYQRSGDPRKASDVVCWITGQDPWGGQYKSADDLLAGDQSDGIVRGILRSRLLLQLGATDDAVRESTATLEAAESIHHEYRALAAQNAASIAYGARTFDLVAELGAARRRPQ